MQFQSQLVLPNPSHPWPLQLLKDRWSKVKHIELVNIIGNLGAGTLTRVKAKQLSAASAHECLFVDFLSEKEPKKVSDALKHPGLKAIRVFLAFATYMNFTVCQMDVKSTFLNGKLKEEFYVKQPLGFESSEFPNHVCKLDKALYGLKQAPRACENSSDTPNNLGPDLNGKAVNKTEYRGMIGSLMYLTVSKSTSGACQLLGGKLVCWSAKKHQSVAMSSTEAEYVVAAGCCANIL
ncbi:retrovirus-related pol polyprotein from transposon TNT 1-94 [Tanacetum coccineum]